jgi:tetratricopeptide (TPR) repeat protein/DNA-binding XRE family transcriptional regulator
LLMALKRRPLGLNVIPERVRQARHEAKLSLAQLARGDISRTAIHLVETGKSRPSLTTLKLIAERTGRPLDFFLEAGQSDVIKAETDRQSVPEVQDLELAVSQERFDDAKIIGRALLAALTDRGLRGRVCIHCAEAFLRTASVEEALPLLAEARAIFEASDDRWMLAECLDWQAAAEHLLENPAALALARHALGLAKSLDPVPSRTLVRIYGRIGSICVAQHKWHEAIDAYQQAVQSGAGLLDMSRLAKMYNDLSIAYRRVGQLSDAAEAANKAVSIHEVLQDRLSIARAETNLALVLMKQHEPEDAGPHLDRALGLFVEANQKRGRAHILLAQAELQYDRSDFPGARVKAEEGARLAVELGETASLSEAKQILATIAAAEGDDQNADGLFDESIKLLEELNLPERLTTVHAIYARTLERRGDISAALHQWRLAVAATHPEAAFDSNDASPTSRQIESA